MRLLFDTHLLIWAATAPEHVSQTAAKLMADAAKDLIFSTVSVVEVSIKWAQGQPDFRIDPRDFGICC